MHFRRTRAAVLSGILVVATATGVVATDEARAPANPGAVAATVNGHPLPMADVVGMLLRDPSVINPIVDKLIDDSLIEQEAANQHIAATTDEIMGRKEQLVALNPTFQLGDLLRRHHETMTDLEHDIRIWIETVKLLTPGSKPPKMIQVRHILIRVTSPGQTAAQSETSHTDTEALAIVHKIQAEWKGGRKFEDLAREYSEDPGTRANGGDLGVVYEGVPFDPNLLAAALTLTEPGETLAGPVKSSAGYYWLQAISTGRNHPESQNAMYANVAVEARALRVTDAQIQAFIRTLRDNALIVNHYTGN